MTPRPTELERAQIKVATARDILLPLLEAANGPAKTVLGIVVKELLEAEVLIAARRKRSKAQQLTREALREARRGPGGVVRWE